MRTTIFILVCAFAHAPSLVADSENCEIAYEALSGRSPWPVRFLARPVDPSKALYREVPSPLRAPFKAAKHAFGNTWTAFNDLAALRPLVRWGTRRLWNDPRETRAWFAVPMQIFAYSKVSAWGWENAYSYKLRHYDRVINTDPRFADLLDLLTSGTPRGEVRRMAHDRLKYLRLYYEQLRPTFKLPLTDEMRSQFLYSPLFLDASLVQILEQGVMPVEGFQVPKEAVGPVSNEKIDKIIESKVRLYDQLLYADEVISPSKEFEAVRAKPAVRAKIAELLDGDFAQALLVLKERGILSEEDVVKGLKDNAYWRSTFEVWNILGTHPSKDLGDVDNDGEFTINDLQTQRIQDLKARPRKL